jgi:hypothetical protein
MPKYLVQVAIPTMYVIDAMSPIVALDKAAKRFKKEHKTHLEPELQWAELTGSDTDAVWRITDWGVLPLQPKPCAWQVYTGDTGDEREEQESD